MRFTCGLVFGSLVSCLAFVGASRADDPPAPEKAPAGADWELRLFHVGAMTRKSPDHRIERGPFPVTSDEVNDEGKPLYGGESEEVSSPYGSVDDVIELVKNAVPDAPRWFSTDGVRIAAIGTRVLAVRGPRGLQDAIASVLEGFERRDSSTITIDVLALRGDAASAKDGGLAAAVASGALVPLAGARSSGFGSRSITARMGSDQAYVQREMVEVAKEAKASDPDVGISKRGLAFSAVLTRATAERVSLQFTAWWADPAAPTLVVSRANDVPVETIVTDGRTADAILDLVPGTWSVVAANGNVTFAVRASVHPHDTPRASPSPIPTSDLVPTPPFSLHAIDVRKLWVMPVDSVGEVSVLWPSGYKLPEPPERLEPMPEFPADALVETIRALSSAAWDVEGTSIDLKDGSLYLKTDDARSKATSEMLDGIHASLGRTTRLRAIVVALPLASIPEYLTGLDDGAALLIDGGKALLARAGAQIIDRAGVLCRSGQRNASVGGKRHAYVGDYDVEIAESSVIGKPVNRAVLAGLSFDVESCAAAEGAAVCCDLRIDRTTWDATRQVKTPYGDLECPTLGVSRLRGETMIPIGSQRIVGATLDAGVVTLTIVSATSE